MKNIVKDFLNQIKQDKHRRRKSCAVMLVLSILVASGVLWQMKITGITMTDEALCGYLQHQHTAECLGMQVACGLEETDGHRHTDACKTTDRVLVCRQEAHSHVEGECYVLDVSECEQEEHQHTDSCYETDVRLICGLEESAGHKHTDACEREGYVCGYEKEHIHTLLCYSDIHADLESSSDWEKTIQVLSFNPAKDLAMVARSQVGYAESQRNYKVAEDGITKRGYTRYGEWYGNPYGDWNAMFVSFCLHYAQHPAYETLKNSGVESMRLAAETGGLYQAAAGTVPYVGDLAFLDKDSNGSCDTVAIVTDREGGAMTLVEGDCGGIVAENTYSLENGTVLGYALLTPQASTADEPIDEDGTYNLTKRNEEAAQADGNITITFMINNPDYTHDPGSGYTHLTVSLAEENNPAGDGYSTDGGLSYEYWTTDGRLYKHKVTGTGTLMTQSIPAGTTLAASGFALPNVSTTNIADGNTDSYVSPYSWVTDGGMICNANTVFAEDTTLYLSLYPSGQSYNLNWVCNCENGGSHSVYYNLTSRYPSPTFALGQSLSANYILSAEDVNRTYAGTPSCNVGSSHNKVFTGWYLKNETTGAMTKFGVGVPFAAEYVDPNSSGYSIKVYAHWRERQEPVAVTATFVNGDQSTTATLNRGDALGNNLPTVTAPEGQIFLGWRIGETDSYATAETVIEGDTTYTAVFAETVTVTFMNGDTEFLVRRDIPKDAKLWNYLPEQTPEYTGTADTPMSFAGWTWRYEDKDIPVTQETQAQSNMVLYALFEETTTYSVYLHDMAPDGVTDYETGGQNVQVSQMALPVDTTLKDALAEDPYRMIKDGVPAADCIWYIKQTVDGRETYVRYALDENVTGDLHLYTFHYTITLTLEEPSTRTSSLNLFPVASAEIGPGQNGLTLTLREGEKPTAADFVVNGVDYSLYIWTANGETVNISDIITNGVTKNITATATGTMNDTLTQTSMSSLHFFVCINGQWTEVKTVQNMNVYTIDHQRYYLTPAQLETIYGKYGFNAGTFKTTDYFFLHEWHNENGVTNIWTATQAITTRNGAVLVPLTTATGDVDVYYLPGNTTAYDDGINVAGLGENYSFYTVTINDKAGIYNTAGVEVPAVSYVFTGGTAQITLLTPESGQAWKKDGAVLSGTDNGNGTTTYTFENVTAPIVITSSSDKVTVSVVDTGNAVYNETETRPSVTVGIGGDVSITVKNKAGYGWLANGMGITGGQINDNETTITYTFTNVTINIVLTPVALKEQVTVNYSIGTLPSVEVITSTRPTIKNGTAYTDTVNLTESSYIVLTPDKTQYTRTGNVSLVTVTFKGWDTGKDGTVDLKAGQVLTAAELSQYGETVNLTAVWEDQGYEGSVSFYINLELQVLDYNGSTADTPNSDFTGAIYGTEVRIDPAPATAYQTANVLQAAFQNETAAIDAKIRTLTDGVTATYMNAEREFTLMTFPDDENALAQIRQRQRDYITAYETWTAGRPAENRSVAAYRDEGNKIIWDSDTGEYIPWEEITSENYTIRWYVFKYDDTNGWHVDGVLVKKQGQLTITKTFYGNSAAIQAVKNSLYTISVMDGENAIYTLDLDPENTSSNTGYVNYDASTDTYTWKIDLTTNKRYTLKENNYTVASNVVNGMSMASLAEYMVINGDDVPRTNYPSDGISVTAKAYSVDVDYTSYKTAKFYNSYIPTNAMLLRKVDDSKNTLPGIRFQLKKNNQIKQLYQDRDGTYYIYRPADIETKAVDCITTDALGQAIIIGLKDATYAGEYKLIELEAPEGYSKIEEEMAFNLAENGTLSVVGESSYIDLLEDGITLQVTNTSHTMDVTVKKVWSDNSNKEVKVALYLNGAAMSSDTYEVTLNADNSWTYTWKEMPAYVGGSLASYTIRETWIGESAYSGTIDDGYENYVVTYSNPAYTYDSSGMPTALALTVTNRTDSGEVEFTKVDHNNVGLQGAVFQLYSDEDCTTAYGSATTSEAHGKVSFGNLAAGVYYMKETQAPDGYQANSTVYEVKVTGSGTTIKELGTDTAITTISNIPANANLRVKKTDDKGNTLTDASFELYKKNADDGWDKQAIDGKNIFTVDSNGMINFTNLSNGDYKLEETSAPAGYYRLTEEIPFTVNLGNVTCESKDGAWTFTNGDPAIITVVNVPGSELPQTGGMGTHFGTMAGLLMMAGSLLYGFLLRRKRERGAV